MNFFVWIIMQHKQEKYKRKINSIIDFHISTADWENKFNHNGDPVSIKDALKHLQKEINLH